MPCAVERGRGRRAGGRLRAGQNCSEVLVVPKRAGHDFGEINVNRNERPLHLSIKWALSPDLRYL